MQRSQSGFTLVELSIVLVIVGLIVGGVLAGQSMIRAAAIQGVIRDSKSYVAAVNQFQLKYNAIPGDMPNAVAFWGAAAGGTVDNYTNSCSSNKGTGTQTCNGNGDGMIGQWGVDWLNYEQFRAWQHLVNAGLVPGTYTGVAASGADYAGQVGVNIPATRITGAGFSLFTRGVASGDGAFFDGDYGSILVLGAQAAALNQVARYPVLTAAEAYSIDSKIDDGKPGSGQVTSDPSGSLYSSSCTNGNNTQGATASYLISGSGVVCSLVFKTGL